MFIVPSGFTIPQIQTHRGLYTFSILATLRPQQTVRTIQKCLVPYGVAELRIQIKRSTAGKSWYPRSPERKKRPELYDARGTKRKARNDQFLIDQLPVVVAEEKQKGLAQTLVGWKWKWGPK